MSAVEIIHVDRPGELSADVRRELEARLVETDSEAFGGVDMLPFWASGPDFLNTLDGIYFATADSDTVGLLAYRLLPSPRGLVLHIHALAVLAEFRRQRVGWQLAGRALMKQLRSVQFRGFYVCGRTANPALIEMLSRAVGREFFLPQVAIGARAAHRELREVAKHTASVLNPECEFDAEHSVIRGAFGTSAQALTGVYETRASEDIKDLFRSSVDVANGDCVLLALKWDLRALSHAVFPERDVVSWWGAGSNWAVFEWSCSSANQSGVSLLEVDDIGDITFWRDYLEPKNVLGARSNAAREQQET